MGNNPVFNSRFISVTSFDRFYRIYVVGDQLFFIRVGGQGGIKEGITHQSGLLGLLVATLMEKRAEKKNKALLEAMDQTNPEQLLSRHKENFRLSAVEMKDGTVDPPSFLATHGAQVGRFLLNLRDGKTMNFQFEKIDDMRIALDVLPELFSSGFQVNVQWNANKKRYEKKKCAA